MTFLQTFMSNMPMAAESCIWVEWHRFLLPFLITITGARQIICGELKIGQQLSRYVL
jgi:hypothetical protein